VTVFLEVVVDSNLTWDAHINKMSDKINSSLRIINKLSKTTEQRIYYGLVCPFLSYGIIIWRWIAKKYTMQLFILQKMTDKMIGI